VAAGAHEAGVALLEERLALLSRHLAFKLHLVLVAHDVAEDLRHLAVVAEGVEQEVVAVGREADAEVLHRAADPRVDLRRVVVRRALEGALRIDRVAKPALPRLRTGGVGPARWAVWARLRRVAQGFSRGPIAVDLPSPSMSSSEEALVFVSILSRTANSGAGLLLAEGVAVAVEVDLLQVHAREARVLGQRGHLRGTARTDFSNSERERVTGFMPRGVPRPVPRPDARYLCGSRRV
jgi:hypothetical protein